MSEKVVTWEEMADYWDQKQGDEGDLWHRALINPTVLRVLGHVAGRQVLDLACGNGALARELARRGAIVTGADASAPIISRARAREAQHPLDIAYHAADASRLVPIQDGAFDVVVCNMALMDIADAEGAVREAARVLRVGGRFVVSIPHPCFDVGSASAWVVERIGQVSTVWRKVSRYREPREDVAYWRLTPERMCYTRVYHRPLSWYFRVLGAAGFGVTALEEPEPMQEFMEKDFEGPWVQQIPLHCVFAAVKLR